MRTYTVQQQYNYMRAVYSEVRRLATTPEWANQPKKELITFCRAQESANRKMLLLQDIQTFLLQLAVKPGYANIRTTLTETSITILQYLGYRDPALVNAQQTIESQKVEIATLTTQMQAQQAELAALKEQLQKTVVVEAPAVQTETEPEAVKPEPVTIQEEAGIFFDGKQLALKSESIQAIEIVDRGLHGWSPDDLLDRIQSSKWNGSIYKSLSKKADNRRRIFLSETPFEIDMKTVSILQTVVEKANELQEGYSTILKALRKKGNKRIYKTLHTTENDKKIYKHLITVYKTLDDVFIKASIQETVTYFQGLEKKQQMQLTEFTNKDEYNLFMSQNASMFRKEKIRELEKAL